MTIDTSGAVVETNESDNTYTKTISVTGGTPQPNLTPTQPSGWSDKMVVSTGPGTNTDSAKLTTNDTLYVDWSVKNNGNHPATGSSFQATLKVDGVLKNTWTVSALNANASTFIADYSIGSLSSGSHNLLLTIDTGGAVTESDETDNTYTKTISVTEVNPPNPWFLVFRIIIEDIIE